MLTEEQTKGRILKNKYWQNLKTVDILALFGIVITLVFGGIGYRLSKAQFSLSLKQDSTSLDLKHFAQLLEKTDTVINTTNSQLLLNKEVKAATDNGDKNRFIAAVFRIGAKIGTRSSMRDGFEETEAVAKYINELIPIFESQMNNPFLCQNDTMLGLWVNAYVHLNIVGHMGQYSSEFSSEFDQRAPSPIDVLSDIKLNCNSDFHT